MTPPRSTAGAARSGGRPTPRLLFVVSRDDSSCLEYIRRYFAEEPGVEIVDDRRQADRRVARDTRTVERRSGQERRQQPLRGDLGTLGWVLVTMPPAAADTEGPACG